MTQSGYGWIKRFCEEKCVLDFRRNVKELTFMEDKKTAVTEGRSEKSYLEISWQMYYSSLIYKEG